MPRVCVLQKMLRSKKCRLRFSTRHMTRQLRSSIHYKSPNSRAFHDDRHLCRVRSPRGAFNLPAPERHAAALAHHACITYRRPVDSRARHPSRTTFTCSSATAAHDDVWLAAAPQLFLMRRPHEHIRNWHSVTTTTECGVRLFFVGLLLRKSGEVAGNMPFVRLVDDDCMAALLVKAHTRPGRPHGGEGRRNDR